MENKTQKKKKTGISPAMRIGAIIMAGLMLLGMLATTFYYLFV